MAYEISDEHRLTLHDYLDQVVDVAVVGIYSRHLVDCYYSPGSALLSPLLHSYAPYLISNNKKKKK